MPQPGVFEMTLVQMQIGKREGDEVRPAVQPGNPP